MPPDIVIKRKGDKFLFLNPSVPAWLITNSNGANALKLCNGKRTVSEISRRVSIILNRDATKEIQNFFQEVIAGSSLLSFNGPETIILKPYNLDTVHLSLTNNCNLKCIYCYADERSKKEKRLDFDDYLHIIDSINNLTNKVNIVLTGGEPLLVSYALDIAGYAKKKGNSLQLLSNGILINNENVDKISEMFDLIKISLDGCTSATHDFHRGEGAFYKTMHAIELLIRKNARFQISMTVTKRNIHDMGNMAKKFGSLLSFAPLFNAGRAKGNKKLSITGKEYYNALSSLDTVNPMSYLCSSIDRAKNQRITKCAIGDAEISISESGDVFPCHLLHLPQFMAGNVREQSLETIYQTSNNLFSCRQLNVLNVKGCNTCDLRFICGGACRARAYYEKKKINVSDEFCVYEKQAYFNGLFELHRF